VSVRAGVLANVMITAMLGSVLLSASACSPGSQICAGQCGPPFQLQVDFQPGIAEQAALAAMRACQASQVVIRIGQPHRIGPGAPGQWTAIIYTKKWSYSATHALLACLRHSPAVLMAGFGS
jgi:hypothetical protein